MQMVEAEGKAVVSILARKGRGIDFNKNKAYNYR
jgi:GTP cyclohydrolase II